MNNQLENATATVVPEPVIAQRLSDSPETLHKIAGEQTDKPLIQEELVIEEISIDGMCGVY
jgi:mycofactocin precursor